MSRDIVPFTEPPHPAAPAWKRALERTGVVALTSVFGVPILALLLATKTTLSTMCGLWGLAFSAKKWGGSILAWNKSQGRLASCSRDMELFEKACALPSVQAYLRAGALEYQKREGYCASATQRCMLRSIDSFPLDRLPTPKLQPTLPKAVADHLNAASSDACQIQASVVAGSDGYKAFREAMSKSNSHKEYRVAVNFLRSALFGMPEPAWLPYAWLLSLVGGHFSPVLGFLEEEDLVVVFDVNHKYGLYLCPCERMYIAVNTIDVSSREGCTRGLVVAAIS